MESRGGDGVFVTTTVRAFECDKTLVNDVDFGLFI